MDIYYNIILQYRKIQLGYQYYWLSIMSVNREISLKAICCALKSNYNQMAINHLNPFLEIDALLLKSLFNSIKM